MSSILALLTFPRKFAAFMLASKAYSFLLRLVHVAVLSVAHLLSSLCYLVPEADERGVPTAQRFLKLLQGSFSMPLCIDRFAKLLVAL